MIKLLKGWGGGGGEEYTREKYDSTIFILPTIELGLY